MKKVLSLMMAALMVTGVLTATSCSSSDDSQDDTTAAGTTAADTTTADTTADTADTGDDDVASYKVGVQSGTTGFSFMTGDEDWGFDGFKNDVVSAYDNGGLAVTDMLNGNIDFVVIDDAPAKNLVASNPGTKLIDIALTTESYGIGVNKDDEALLNSINTILEENADAIASIFDMYSSVTEENAANYKGTTYPAGTYDASKEQFVIATNAAFAPYEFTVGSNYAGIDIDLAKLIANKLGQELVIMDMNFDSVVTSVGKNGIDAAMSGLTINAKRKKSVNFTDAYCTEAYQVIVCKEDCTLFDNCKTADDLIAVLSGIQK